MKKNTNIIAKNPASVIARYEAISALCRSTDRLHFGRYMPGIFVIVFCLLFSLSSSAQNAGATQKDTSKTSFTGNTKPLVILDGMPYKGDIKSIDPNTIMDVTILKGNNATSVYGADASAGAIVIRTKNYKAKADTSKLSSPLHTGSVMAKRPLIILDGKEYTKDLKTIDPHTIASINVLKNKNATDKYGPKAANGVLEITTKK